MLCAWNPHPPCYRRAKNTLDRLTDHATSCTTPHNAHTFLSRIHRYMLLLVRVHRDCLSGRIAPNMALHHPHRGASARGQPKIVVGGKGKDENELLQVHRRPRSHHWESMCSRAAWPGARARRAEHCATARRRALPMCTRPQLKCNESPWDGAPNLRCVGSSPRHRVVQQPEE